MRSSVFIEANRKGYDDSFSGFNASSYDSPLIAVKTVDEMIRLDFAQDNIVYAKKGLFINLGW